MARPQPPRPQPPLPGHPFPRSATSRPANSRPAPEIRRSSLPGKPHEDDTLRSNSVSFLVSGFPSGISEKDLWQIVHPVCSRSGRLVNVIIPNRLDKAGQRFGFLVVRNCSDLSVVSAGLRSVFVQGSQIKAAVARSKPHSKTFPSSKHFTPTNQISRIPLHPHSLLPLPPAHPVPPSGLSKVRSFAEVLTHNINPTPVSPSTSRGSSLPNTSSYSPSSPPAHKSQSSNRISPLALDPDESMENWLSKCAVGETDTVASADELQSVFREEGFGFVISALGPRRFLFSAQEDFSFGDFIAEDKTIWSKWLSRLYPCSPLVFCEERVVWIKVFGLPLRFWSPKNYVSIAGSFGELLLVDPDTSSLNCLESIRFLISTKSRSFINERVMISYQNQFWEIFVSEDVKGWHSNQNHPFGPVCSSEPISESSSCQSMVPNSEDNSLLAEDLQALFSEEPDAVLPIQDLVHPNLFDPLTNFALDSQTNPSDTLRSLPSQPRQLISNFKPVPTPSLIPHAVSPHSKSHPGVTEPLNPHQISKDPVHIQISSSFSVIPAPFTLNHPTPLLELLKGPISPFPTSDAYISDLPPISHPVTSPPQSGSTSLPKSSSRPLALIPSPISLTPILSEPQTMPFIPPPPLPPLSSLPLSLPAPSLPNQNLVSSDPDHQPSTSVAPRIKSKSKTPVLNFFSPSVKSKIQASEQSLLLKGRGTKQSEVGHLKHIQDHSESSSGIAIRSGIKWKSADEISARSFIEFGKSLGLDISGNEQSIVDWFCSKERLRS